MTTDLVRKYKDLRSQLEGERQRLVARLQEIEGVLEGRAPTRAASARATKPVKRKLSRAAIARIRAAQKARWAKVKQGQPSKKTGRAAKPARRKLSAAARARIAAAAKARWAKAKAEGRSSL